MKLKLTDRERTLFVIAIICLVAVIVYYGAIKTQLDKVSELEKKAKEYSILIKDIASKVSLDNPLYAENKLLYAKTEKLLKRYYPAIIQENIILLLDEKLKKTNVTLISTSFSEPAFDDLKPIESEQLTPASELEDLVKELYSNMLPSNKIPNNKTVESKKTKVLESIVVKKMTATLSVQGSYSQIYNFLNEIELENKSIICREINMTSSINNILICDLILDFYSVPKPFEQEGDNIEWDIKGIYGKENPYL
ncbi:MAG TPA: hypothetical protein VMV86_04810 [Methanosarcinales archaeon]|nr:hypothetical protein [Methanosarcinales archaeon]